jgi:hypothetical protein
MAEWPNGAQAMHRLCFKYPTICFAAHLTILPFGHWGYPAFAPTLRMLKYLHQLSALFFYALGSSFFVAYVLLRNDVRPSFTALWLQTADLPFALCAILYGGLSLYLSLQSEGSRSRTLQWGIGVPLAALFLLLLVLNFWGA